MERPLPPGPGGSRCRLVGVWPVRGRGGSLPHQPGPQIGDGTQCLGLPGLHNRTPQAGAETADCHFSCLGSQQSKVRVSSGLVPPEAPPPAVSSHRVSSVGRTSLSASSSSRKDTRHPSRRVRPLTSLTASGRMQSCWCWGLTHELGGWRAAQPETHGRSVCLQLTTAISTFRVSCASSSSPVPRAPAGADRPAAQRGRSAGSGNCSASRMMDAGRHRRGVGR